MPNATVTTVVANVVVLLLTRSLDASGKLDTAIRQRFGDAEATERGILGRCGSKARMLCSGPLARGLRLQKLRQTILVCNLLLSR